MHQPCSSAGPPAGPRRPAAPKPLLNAARIMYEGAAVSAAELIGALPFMGDIHGKALGHRLTATPLAITVVIVVLLAGSRGVVQVLTVAPAWLAGLAVEWLLCRPAASAFFKPQRFA
jgi:hypothetical protein